MAASMILAIICFIGCKVDVEGEGDKNPPCNVTELTTTCIASQTVQHNRGLSSQNKDASLLVRAISKIN